MKWIYSNEQTSNMSSSPWQKTFGQDVPLFISLDTGIELPALSLTSEEASLPTTQSYLSSTKSENNVKGICTSFNNK